MFIEREAIVGLANNIEGKKSVKKTSEEILKLALEDLRSDQQTIDQGLELLESGYRNRELVKFGESERLSPVRASAFYVLAFKVSPFYEAVREVEGEMADALSELADGMSHIPQALIAAESVIHGGAEGYVSSYLSKTEREKNPSSAKELEGLVGIWAKNLQRYPDGFQFVADELIVMHLYMSGYDPHRSAPVKPHSILTPMNVRGGKFAADAYKVVYPRAAMVFGSRVA